MEGCEKGLLMGDRPILAVGPSAPLAAVELRSRGLRPYWCSGSASPIDSYGQGDPKRLPQPAPAGGRAECLQELAMPLRELGILARGLEPLTTIRRLAWQLLGTFSSSHSGGVPRSCSRSSSGPGAAGVPVRVPDQNRCQGGRIQISSAPSSRRRGD